MASRLTFRNVPHPHVPFSPALSFLGPETNCEMTILSLICFAVIRGRRQKRGLKVTNFKNCLRTLRRDMHEYAKRDGCFHPDTYYDVSCRMEPRLMNCFYYVTCKNMATFKKFEYDCTEVHESSQNPSCCDFVCPTK